MWLKVPSWMALVKRLTGLILRRRSASAFSWGCRIALIKVENVLREWISVINLIVTGELNPMGPIIRLAIHKTA